MKIYGGLARLALPSSQTQARKHTLGCVRPRKSTVTGGRDPANFIRQTVRAPAGECTQALGQCMPRKIKVLVGRHVTRLPERQGIRQRPGHWQRWPGLFVTGRMDRAKGLDNANFSQNQFVTYYKRRAINLNLSIDLPRGSGML